MPPRGTSTPNDVVEFRLCPALLIVHKDLARTVLVDREDLPRVNAVRWCIAERVGGYLAVTRSQFVGDRQRTIYLARFILGAPDGLVPDHINGNTLDNRRANLRLVTPAENAQNRSANGSHSLGLRGVTFYQGRYQARATVGGVMHRLGRYSTAEEAAKVAADFRAENMPFAVSR